jgi:hypothetical protein
MIHALIAKPSPPPLFTEKNSIAGERVVYITGNHWAILSEKCTDILKKNGVPPKK